MAVTVPEATARTASDDELQLIDRYWRATNYLSVGQIYLMDNPLLEQSLALEHIKPRLLGHWGTTPGLNFVYVHLNRAIKAYDLDMIYICGPGHGGPAMVANTYLEGTYSELYPDVSEDLEGMTKLFKQFSFPGGIPSHAAPETPGSIHEGGELGYAISHAYGAAFDNPDLIVACVIGDGEAETGPLATSWHSNKFLSPVSDGAVLPILHLNGYKIANPTIFARVGREELESLFVGYGYKPYFVEGSDPAVVHRAMADTLDQVVGEIKTIQHDARENGIGGRPRWPMIVLADAEGLDGPEGGRRQEDRGLLALAPGADGGDGVEPGAYRAARRVDAQLPPGGALRRERDAPGRAAGARPRRGRVAWERTRTPTGVCSCATCACRTSTATRSTSRRPARWWQRPRR